MKYVITHDGTEHEVEVRETEDGGHDVILDGTSYRADFRRCSGEALYSLLLDGRSYEILMLNDRDQVSVIHHGLSVDLRVESERERNARLIAADSHAGAGDSITAVMPGIVVSVAVAEGEAVVKGQPLVVLEAMKMENEIKSPAAGVVVRVAVRPGETVNAGDLLVEITGD